MKKNTLLSLFIFALLPCFAQQADTSKKRLLTTTKNAVNFIAMGDFGRNGEDKQKEVAVQMGKTAKELNAGFFIITGDNFYPSGVASTQDYSWLASFEQVYTAHSLQNPWYVVLGNHDYKGNVQAEIDYTKISRRWYMPSRYYSRTVPINEDTTQKILFIFLDTSPFITKYYSSEDHKSNIQTQDTAAQKSWLDHLLQNRTPDIKWTFIVGHHPLFTGGKRMYEDDTRDMYNSFKPVFDKYKVDAYICGHEHSLQYIQPAGRTSYFITGAGSETTKASLYPEGGKFARQINGFMCFSVTPKDMLIQIVSVEGDILYTDKITRQSP